MSRSPAAELARIKIQFPGWSIRPVDPGKGDGYTARRRAKHARPLHAATLTELESALVSLRARHHRTGGI